MGPWSPLDETAELGGGRGETSCREPPRDCTHGSWCKLFSVRTIPGTFQGAGENPYVYLDAQNTFLTLVTQKGV